EHRTAEEQSSTFGPDHDLRTQDSLPCAFGRRIRDSAATTSALPNLTKTWCTGEDSNLRSSKERQIYSLLPLTTRPPVHNQKMQNGMIAPEHSADAFPRRPA